MSLQDQLAQAEATAARLRREIAQGPCLLYGHDWQFSGGKSANCDGAGNCCACSVLVHTCTKCGDCDYGDTPEADGVRTACARLSGR